jgi:carbamate kinase
LSHRFKRPEELHPHALRRLRAGSDAEALKIVFDWMEQPYKIMLAHGQTPDVSCVVEASAYSDLEDHEEITTLNETEEGDDAEAHQSR